MTQEQTSVTRGVIDRFYVAYLAGNLEGMLAEIADDAAVTFAGHGTFRGKGEIRPYMEWGGKQLPELRFNVRNKIVDGERAAVNWDETGRTKRGDDWDAIGCDVYRVVDGKIVELTVYGDTEKMARLMDKYPG
jgi:ketosteroid isomerase-like protein